MITKRESQNSIRGKSKSTKSRLLRVVSALDRIRSLIIVCGGTFSTSPNVLFTRTCILRKLFQIFSLVEHAEAISTHNSSFRVQKKVHSKENCIALMMKLSCACYEKRVIISLRDCKAKRACLQCFDFQAG